MNVANLDNCKKLYKLSGWGDVTKLWFNSVAGWVPELEQNVEDCEGALDMEPGDWLPAYDLGYLVRKLPARDNADRPLTLEPYEDATGDWNCGYFTTENIPNGLNCDEDTPEDAACLLAIELFEQGILVKEGAKNVKAKA